MPIPKPRKNEEKDGFISRCMGDDVMNTEYPDSSIRAGVCNTAWEKKSMSNELNVEIFAVGTWNGMAFSKEDLNLIAFAFDKLKERHQVPLKMGHNDEQPFTDGQPALGWVADVWVVDDKLMAKFIDVPDVVYEAFNAKLYKNVSIELDMGVEHKGEYYTWVLSGVALLGADIPAVNTLADLQAYMSKDVEPLTFKKRMAFTAIENKPKPQRRKSMSGEDEVTIESLKKELAAQKAETEKALMAKMAAEKKEIEDRAKFKAMEEVEKNRKQIEERDLLSAKLEAMVVEKQIAPFTRDSFLQDYDQAEDKSVIIYAVDTMKKTIDDNPSYFGAEQARKNAERQKNESEVGADVVVVQRTREYMAKHGEKNFSAAKQVVLQADIDLANRYTKMEG